MAPATFARDIFLLTQILPRHESPIFNALAFDYAVEKLGPPGTGYDPLKVFDAANELHRTHGRAYLELQQRGMDALRDAGWFPEAEAVPALAKDIADYARRHIGDLKRTAFPPRQSPSGAHDE